MGTLIVGAIAALAGMLAGFWLRAAAARGEKAHLEQRVADLARDLGAVRAELAQAQAGATARARFEALAEERERTMVRLGEEKDALRAELQSKSDGESRAQARIREVEAELRKEREAMAEKLALLESARHTLSDQFQALAADILEKKSKSFAEGSQKEIDGLLKPLKTQIEEFRKKVEEAQSDSKTGVATLQGLIGGLSNLNQQLTEQARNLTTALRGSAKAQGDWGEFILRDLLEKAGLREGEQFSFQQSFSVDGEEGERARAARTDVILLLPGGRNLVIDSKVSLNAYTDYANAATDAERSAALRQHLASVRSHVVGLSKAGYHRLPGLETPDFVVMFVPVEPAFLIALQSDGELWADAYRQNVLLVGPTTLLYIIRIVNVLWQQETQARNVKEVMERGARLYEKFAGFVGDMEEIGKSLRNASACYEDARNKLSVGPGNLIKQVEMLRQLGVKPRKMVPAKFLEAADVEEPSLALAAEAEGDGARQ